MNIAWPWLALILPLWWLLPRSRKSASAGALEHPYLMSLSQQQQAGRQPASRAGLVMQVAWILLVVALVRPQWIGAPVSNVIAGRSIFLAVDLSGSMLEPDMSWNGRAIERYQAVQAVVGQFVEQRQQDFIGLVVFGSFAEIQAPLTPDVQAVSAILRDLRPGMAGDSTAIGDGLALAVKQLRLSESPDKVIILLSDGENKTGDVTPEEAMTVAQQSDIKVYTIGFGGDRQNSFLARLTGTANDIDERTLKTIAEQTQGRYFRATSTQDLAQVFQTIDSLETSDRDDRDVRLVVEYYWLPLLLSFLLIMVATTLPRRLGAKPHDLA
ncbi:VWA domain-containing protein [Reinekea sp.]|uniref:VWA domain-containing protein n=1 Tax=Reinekea sp. TaxID=1970455 RepID=UPI002A7F23ED|nr:VWA domain-containing protein [Reinekea sp.]